MCSLRSESAPLLRPSQDFFHYAVSRCYAMVAPGELGAEE